MRHWKEIVATTVLASQLACAPGQKRNPEQGYMPVEPLPRPTMHKNATEADDGPTTMFMDAVYSQNATIRDALLAQGVDQSMRLKMAKGGRHNLLYAVANLMVEEPEKSRFGAITLEKMIESGFDVNYAEMKTTRDKKDKPIEVADTYAFFGAFKNGGNPDAARIFAKHIKDINLKDGKGNTVAHHVFDWKGPTLEEIHNTRKVLAILLPLKPDLTQKFNENGQSPRDKLKEWEFGCRYILEDQAKIFKKTPPTAAQKKEHMQLQAVCQELKKLLTAIERGDLRYFTATPAHSR